MNKETVAGLLIVSIITTAIAAAAIFGYSKNTAAITHAPQVVEKKENLFEVVEDYDQHHSYQILRFKPTRTLWVKGLGATGSGPSVFVKISDGEVEVK